MLGNLICSASLIFAVNGLSVRLTFSDGFYLAPCFMSTGISSNFQYWDLTSTLFILDTRNSKNFVYGPDTVCPTCPEYVDRVTLGQFQAQKTLGLVSFGMNSKVYGIQGVTELGIATDEFEEYPAYNWLQETIMAARAVNCPEGRRAPAGNLALGRTESDGRWTSELGSITGLLNGDSTFCIDLGLFSEDPLLQLGSTECDLIEQESCNQAIQLPIYVASDPTWNVAMSSFQFGSDASNFIDFPAQVVLDTTRKYAVFPQSVALALANLIATVTGSGSVTEGFTDGYYTYEMTPTGFFDDQLLINFSSYNPVDSPWAKHFIVPPGNYMDYSEYSVGDPLPFAFYGSKDSCIVGNAEVGYKAIIGTSFMYGSYFGFHPGFISIIQSI